MMNHYLQRVVTLTRTSALSSSTSCRSFASVGSVTPKKPWLPPMYHTKNNFTNAWLSDPSTYPLLLVLGSAGFFVVGACVNALFFGEDVQLTVAKKSSVIRNWITEPRPSITARMVAVPPKKE